MQKQTHDELAKEVIQTNRYLTLATSDGRSPWVATLEYLVDERLNFYFLSLPSSRHSQHLNQNQEVALSIFDSKQEEYAPGISLPLRGVQIEATARPLAEEQYPEPVIAAIEALRPPMPPYLVYKIEPSHFYLPMIEEGVNRRIEVEMTSDSDRS